MITLRLGIKIAKRSIDGLHDRHMIQSDLLKTMQKGG